MLMLKCFDEDVYCIVCDVIVVVVYLEGIELDVMVFYVCSGGQVGDIGMLVLVDG